MPEIAATSQPVRVVLPGVSRLMTKATDQFPRYSEGDVIELTDGRLLLAMGRKEGASDFAAGTIIGMFSIDRGLSWDDDPHVIQALFDDVIDVMSVSLIRSKRGIHLFFLARGKDFRSDTRVYQIISADECKSWSAPIRVSERPGYHIMNNARVIRTNSGRMIAPCAYVEHSIDKRFDHQRIYCLYSDDDATTWKPSGELAIEGQPLMEPGVAQCADGSLYMTIRTKLGKLYEARSRDDGATWVEMRASELDSPAAPSTLERDPNSDDLWMFWCNRPKGTWKERNPQAFAISKDHGKTWSTPRKFEDDPAASYGYISVNWVDQHVLLTYYDWHDRGQPSFQMTNLRQRLIPLSWLKGEPSPPVFRTQTTPVATQDQKWEGKIVSANSGLLIDGDRWRLWYNNGSLDKDHQATRICYAESSDRGITWRKSAEPSVVLPPAGDDANYYHASVHRDGKQIVMYAWRSAGREDSALYRYVSADDGKTFARDPESPLITSPHARPELKEQAGDGRESNDAFDVVKNPDGTWEYFAACLVKAEDPRTLVKHDNAAGQLRFIGRAISRDGVHFSAPQIVIRPDYANGDPFDTQFYGMQVFRHRRFYLGLLQTFHVNSQIIQPEWAWSHDGDNWVRTGTPCIPLGDEGNFDSRMILFGDVTIVGNELVWLYSGYDWRHNAFRQGEVAASIGRATLPMSELDAWLDTLAQP